MKAAEIRNMSAAELETKLADLKKDLFMLRMQHATNQLDNPVKITAVKPRHRARQDRHPREAARGLRRETEMNEMRTTSRKTRVGKVVSDKMDKTVVVASLRTASLTPCIRRSSREPIA